MKLSAAIAALATIPMLHAQLLYVATYTSKDNAPNTNSKGIYAYRFDSKTGKLTSLGLAADAADPSWLTLHPSGKFLYAVNELTEKDPIGNMSAYTMDKNTGKLTLLNKVPTKGSGPCHIAIDSTGKAALVSNYYSGNYIGFQLGADGRIGAQGSLVQETGKGPVTDRQEKAHAHELVIAKNNTTVIGADLGSDKIYVFKLDPATAKLTQVSSASLSPGDGPRHLTFSPDEKRVYVLGELSGTITEFDFDMAKGTLKKGARVSTLAPGYKGKIWAAEIMFDKAGKHLYATNRDDDQSIAVFDYDAASGALKQTQIVKSGGATPRGFVFDPTGNWALVGNQNSNGVAVFKVDPVTGKLTMADNTTKVGGPVGFQFVQ
jgi:6-phosphogluconolactonase